MTIKHVGIGTGIAIVVASIYGVLIWFGVHSDALNSHEREIELLQSELLSTAQENKTVQKGLLTNIQDLEGRLAMSEGDTRSMVENTDRTLRETVEWAEQIISVSVKDEIDTLHKEIADLSGLVDKNASAVSRTRADIDLIISLKKTDRIIRESIAVTVTEESVLPGVVVIDKPAPLASEESPQAILYQEPLTSLCPTTPDHSARAMRILKRSMAETPYRGSYPFAVNFNINSNGTAKDIKVEGGGPEKLRKAVERYVAALGWTVDKAVEGCELKIKLDVG
jgi:hypothetical protein